jgi:hypothetical protein
VQTKAAIISEARSALTVSFLWRDFVRTLSRPYHRFKVKVAARL